MRKEQRSYNRFILASESPRRMDILTNLGVKFASTASRIPEIPFPQESPGAFVRRIAREKALKASSIYRSGIVLGCDTIVVINGKILGKPKNSNDAARMLRMLSGRWHRVFSGICLYDIRRKSIVLGHSTTRVKFRGMTEEDIARYIRTGEPLDKAGGYGIQELGMIFIEKISGSYTGIVGLPIELLVRLLKKMGIDILSLIRQPS